MIDKQKYAKILLTVGTNCLNCGWLEYLHKDTLAYEFFGQYYTNPSDMSVVENTRKRRATGGLRSCFRKAVERLSSLLEFESLALRIEALR